MGDKYIIELEDKPFHKEDGDFLHRVKGFNSLVFDMTGISKLTPYTEPDLERVRKEGYKEGREAGIKDGKCEAWEAARKIWEYDTTTLKAIFGEGIMRMDWFMNFTAAEAIEKLKAYERRKEAEIQVGDEVELKCGVRPAIYMQGTKGSDEIYLLFNDGSCGLHSKSEIVRKTGRHFHEIATILENMRGEQDG